MIEMTKSEDGQTRFRVRTELRGMESCLNLETGRNEWPSYDSRSLAEARLLAAWTANGRKAWDLVTLVRVLIGQLRGGEGVGVAYSEDDLHRVLEEQLGQLSDYVWTIVTEGPYTLLASGGGDTPADKVAGSPPEHIEEVAADEYRKLADAAMQARKAAERPTFDSVIGRYIAANRERAAARPEWLVTMHALESLDGYAELKAAHDAGKAMSERELALFHGRVLGLYDRLTGAVASATKSKRTKAARAARAATTAKRKAVAK